MHNLCKFLLFTLIPMFSSISFADLEDDLVIDKPIEKNNPTEEKPPTNDESSDETNLDAVEKLIEKPEGLPDRGTPSKKTGQKKKKHSTFDSGSSPIEYTSTGGLDANRIKGYIEMVKEVKIRQGDLEMFSDAARANIDPATEEITQIIADGNVRVKKIDPETGKLISAQAQQAIYYRMANKIEFKGAAKLNRGNDILEGDIITYNLLTGDINVKRPKGVLSEEAKGTTVK